MTNLQLRTLMKRHRLSAKDVAGVAMVSISTVRAWLRPKTSKAHRNMTKQSEKLLRDHVAASKPLANLPEEDLDLVVPEATADDAGGADEEPR